jgi:hypothetical protein
LGRTTPVGAFSDDTKTFGRPMRKSLDYEQHAAECRQMAAQMNNPQLKRQLEDMADVWDMLARERRQGVVENNPDQT